ncbi:MAG: hypothetical protein KAK00_00395 [Nanoarchaeota archaeon]|nr:hypothetical protein [Nanoarchaeota archaeon]
MVLGLNLSKKDKDNELKKIIQELILKNDKLSVDMNFKIEDILPSIETLDQDKLYIIILNEQKDRESFTRFYSRLRLTLKWTAPTILVSSRPLQELSEKELESLLEKIRSNKK